MIERIWEYSRFYGELLYSANRLNQNGDGYAAFLLLFNVLELICKSLRESDKDNIFGDIIWLADNGLFTQEEKEFLSGENGIRKIRNIMTHRNPYSFFYVDDEGIIYPFAESETWGIAYREYAPRVIRILSKAIERKSKKNDNIGKTLVVVVFIWYNLNIAVFQGII